MPRLAGKIKSTQKDVGEKESARVRRRNALSAFFWGGAKKDKTMDAYRWKQI